MGDPQTREANPSTSVPVDLDAQVYVCLIITPCFFEI